MIPRSLISHFRDLQIRGPPTGRNQVRIRASLVWSTLHQFFNVLNTRKGEKMKRVSFKSLALAVGLIVALAGVSSAYEDDNIPPGQRSMSYQSDVVKLAQPTRGVVFFTAAINTDGSIASCFHCSGAPLTERLGVGLYQVDFGQNVQATNGWSRWVQADTLGFGSENAWCNTADRAGDSNAVWVNCQTAGGSGSMGNSKPVDTSFFLFVAR